MLELDGKIDLNDFEEIEQPQLVFIPKLLQIPKRLDGWQNTETKVVDILKTAIPKLITPDMLAEQTRLFCVPVIPIDDQYYNKSVTVVWFRIVFISDISRILPVWRIAGIDSPSRTRWTLIPTEAIVGALKEHFVKER